MVNVPVSGIATKIDAQKARVKTAGVRSTFMTMAQAGLKINNMNIKSKWRIFRPANLHRENLQSVYLSLPCFTRTAADEMCVNFTKDFQAIGLFKVSQVRAGAHPAFSRRTNPEINHRHEENSQTLKSKTFPPTKEHVRCAQKTNQQRICKKPEWKSTNVIGQTRQLETIYGSHIAREVWIDRRVFFLAFCL